MATYTTTLLKPNTPWKTGETYTVKAKTTISGSAVGTGETFTISGLLPPGNKTISAVRHYGAEYDTNASPTATIVVGISGTTNGFITSKTAGVTATGISQISLEGDGTLIGTNVTATDVVVTIGGTVATGATSGDVFTEVTYVCGDIA